MMAALYLVNGEKDSSSRKSVLGSPEYRLIQFVHLKSPRQASKYLDSLSPIKAKRI